MPLSTRMPLSTPIPEQEPGHVDLIVRKAVYPNCQTPTPRASSFHPTPPFPQTGPQTTRLQDKRLKPDVDEVKPRPRYKEKSYPRTRYAVVLLRQTLDTSEPGSRAPVRSSVRPTPSLHPANYLFFLPLKTLYVELRAFVTSVLSTL